MIEFHVFSLLGPRAGGDAALFKYSQHQTQYFVLRKIKLHLTLEDLK